MRGKHIKIELNETARIGLEKYAKTGKRSIKLVNRAKIVLELDEANGRKPLTQAKIAEKIGVTRQSVNDAKQAFLGNTVSGLRKVKESGLIAGNFPQHHQSSSVIEASHRSI